MYLPLKVRFFNFFRAIFKTPVLEFLLASMTRDKLPKHLICKLVPNPYQYSPGAYRQIHRNGIELRVDISDYIGHYLYFGFYDDAIEKLFALCQSNFNVIDIGSNIGWVALNFAKRSSSGTIIGFEPDPFNYSVCTNNVTLNSFDNLQVLPYGLGESAATVKMEVRTPDNRGGNRIAPIDAVGSVNVEIKKLDTVEEVLSLSKIHLMKLDVEGYELKVLRGASQILQKHKPILFIEIDNDNLSDHGDSANDVILFLSKIGYTSFVHAETDEVVTEQTDFTNCHFDIIAR